MNKVIPVVLLKDLSVSIEKRDDIFAKAVINPNTFSAKVAVYNKHKFLESWEGDIRDIIGYVDEKYGKLAVELAYYDLALNDFITYAKKVYGGKIPSDFLVSVSDKVVVKDREYREFNWVSEA